MLFFAFRMSKGVSFLESWVFSVFSRSMVFDVVFGLLLGLVVQIF
jgi:hypothetical protein